MIHLSSTSQPATISDGLLLAPVATPVKLQIDIPLTEIPNFYSLTAKDTNNIPIDEMLAFKVGPPQTSLFFDVVEAQTELTIVFVKEIDGVLCLSNSVQTVASIPFLSFPISRHQVFRPLRQCSPRKQSKKKSIEEKANDKEISEAANLFLAMIDSIQKQKEAAYLLVNMIDAFWEKK